MVHTNESIELEVSQLSGTWVKRRNLRNKLMTASNKIINARIEALKREIRVLKFSGVKQQALSPVFAKITQLELRLL